LEVKFGAFNCAIEKDNESLHRGNRKVRKSVVGEEGAESDERRLNRRMEWISEGKLLE
jgi:hypothetical protein